MLPIVELFPSHTTHVVNSLYHHFTYIGLSQVQTKKYLNTPEASPLVISSEFHCWDKITREEIRKKSTRCVTLRNSGNAIINEANRTHHQIPLLNARGKKNIQISR